MQKPKISVRRPPPSVDEFVNGAAASGQPLPAQPPAVETLAEAASGPGNPPVRGMVTRKGEKGEPMQLRRFTVYLKPELGDRLERQCFEQRRQLSDAMAEAIAKWLSDP